ncbi:hypothetical protein BLA29_007213 [Euroglyphus maynei]|uniref:Uncharacterized protein n=1 Tax=Euroglyphus maynei TaxID=6958 RepID=A0A1Y3BEL4_EURMA|nr:hypothetical protein BLA29_007213 [Euroglyphus maynei]
MASFHFISLLTLIFGMNIVVDSIIFYEGHTTACDQCDRISTNSVRNILCCMKFSKCCLPNSLDEYNRQVKAEDDVYYGRNKPNRNGNQSLSALINEAMKRKKKNKKKQSNNNNNKKRKENNVNKRKRPSPSPIVKLNK